MKYLCLTVLSFVFISTVPKTYSASYELESCQYIPTNTNSSLQYVPPGLDEPLNCDYKCFYDELGLSIVGDEQPNLHDMYSIGWRIIDIKESNYGQVVWTVYLERENTSPPNQCDQTHAPKQPEENGE